MAVSGHSVHPPSITEGSAADPFIGTVIDWVKV